LLNTGLVQRIEFIYSDYYTIFLTGKWLLRLPIYGCKFMNAADIYFSLKSNLVTISKQSNETAFGKPSFDYRRNRPAAAAPMRRAVMISNEFDNLPLVRSPSIFLLLPIRKIITSSGTATTPLMTAE